jgi:hypothetical protein
MAAALADLEGVARAVQGAASSAGRRACGIPAGTARAWGGELQRALARVQAAREAASLRASASAAPQDPQP